MSSVSNKSFEQKLTHSQLIGSKFGLQCLLQPHVSKYVVNFRYCFKTINFFILKVRAIAPINLAMIYRFIQSFLLCLQIWFVSFTIFESILIGPYHIFCHDHHIILVCIFSYNFWSKNWDGEYQYNVVGKAYSTLSHMWQSENILNKNKNLTSTYRLPLISTFWAVALKKKKKRAEQTILNFLNFLNIYSFL